MTDQDIEIQEALFRTMMKEGGATATAARDGLVTLTYLRWYRQRLVDLGQVV